jgi:hypothetical protein
MTLHQQRPASEPSQLSIGEMLAGIILFAPLLAVVPLALGTVRQRVWTWLVEHQLVVPTQRWEIVAGIGLDIDRTLILTGLVGLALTLGYATLRRRLQRRS